jgi:hypothetical protein
VQILGVDSWDLSDSEGDTVKDPSYKPMLGGDKISSSSDENSSNSDEISSDSDEISSDSDE